MDIKDFVYKLNLLEILKNEIRQHIQNAQDAEGVDYYKKLFEVNEAKRKMEIAQGIYAELDAERQRRIEEFKIYGDSDVIYEVVKAQNDVQ